MIRENNALKNAISLIVSKQRQTLAVCSRQAVALPTLSKAALVGANTVKGPAPARFSIMPAALRAVWRVEKCSFSAIMAATLLPGFWTATGALVGALGMALMFGLRR